MLLSALAGGGARLVSTLAAFATVPLALNFLGPERYGLWMVVTSLVQMSAAFADGGLVYGLISATAVAHARGGNALVREVAGSAVSVLLMAAMLTAALGLFVVPLIPWDKALAVPPGDLAHEGEAVARILCLGLAVGFLVNIAFKVRTGLQEIPAVSAWEAASSLAALVALYLAIRLQSSMSWLVAAVVGAPLLVKALATVEYLLQRPVLRPRRSDIGFKHAPDLLRVGAAFFVIHVTQAIALQSDQILIAHLAGVDQVATYSVMQRLFAIPLIMCNLVFAAQWPAFSNAAARGDHEWVYKSFKRTLAASLALAVLVALVLGFGYRPLLAAWGVTGIVDPSPALVVGTAVYSVLVVAVAAYSMLLVSLDRGGFQAWCNLAMMAVNVPLSIMLIQRIGSAGAIWGTGVSYFVCLIIPCAIVIPRLLRTLSRTSHSGGVGATRRRSWE